MTRKRPKKGHPVDPEAWGRCAVLWQAISQSTPTMHPTIGIGRALADALEAHGPAIELRLAFIAIDSGSLDFIRSRRLKLTNILHAPHGKSWAGNLDAEAEQWHADGRRHPDDALTVTTPGRWDHLFDKKGPSYDLDA